MSQQQQTKQPEASTKPSAAKTEFGHEAFSELPADFDFDPNAEDPGSRLPVDHQLHDTFYLVVDDKFEKQAAELWVDKHKPDLPYSNLRDTLPLNQLSPNSQVFLIRRYGTRRNPMKQAQPIMGKSDEGYLMHTTTPAQELAEDFRAFGPIKVTEYWTRTGNRFSGGLQTAKLVDRIAQLATPYQVRFRDVTSVMPGQEAVQLYLIP